MRFWKIVLVAATIFTLGTLADEMPSEPQQPRCISDIASEILHEKSGGRITRNQCAEIGSIIETFHENSGILPEVVFAIIEAESNFNPKAVSHRGAIGLMQIIPSTGKLFLPDKHKKSPKKVLLDPQINVMAGLNYLVYLKEKRGERLFVRAYLAGEAANLKANSCIKYHNKINKLSFSYKEDFWPQPQFAQNVATQ